MRLKWPSFKFLQGYAGMWQLSSLINDQANGGQVVSSPTLVLDFANDEYKEGSV